jgi:hypothetical protein
VHARPIADQRPPTSEELKQILFYVSDKGKEIILTLVSRARAIGVVLCSTATKTA